MVVKRGAAINPGNPFERFHVEEDPAAVEELRRIDPEWEPPTPKTAFFVDDTQTLITKNESPDLSFDASLNPYRGCEHGCSYCYARKFHEFLGFSSGVDFEAKIIVKPRAPELLRAEMSRKSWQPTKLALSGVTDCYQPVERKLRITRGCLEVLAEFRNPVVVITKNHLVTRDVDVLAELARWQCGAVLISITTLDRELAASMEPRASGPAMRLRAIRTLADAGIPVGVSVERGCAPMWLRPTSAAGNLVSWSWGFESVVGRILFFIDFQMQTHVRYPPIRRPILKNVDVSYSLKEAWEAAG